MVKQRHNEHDFRIPVKAEVAAVVGTVLYGILDYKLGGLGKEAHSFAGGVLVVLAAYRGIYRRKESKSEYEKIGNAFWGILELVTAMAVFVSPQAAEGLINGIQTYIHSLPDTIGKPQLEQAVQSVTQTATQVVETATQVIAPTMTSTPSLTPTVTLTPPSSPTIAATLDVFKASAAYATQMASGAIEQTIDVVGNSNFLVELGNLIALLFGAGVAGFITKKTRIVGKSLGFFHNLKMNAEPAIDPNSVRGIDVGKPVDFLNDVFGTGD